MRSIALTTYRARGLAERAMGGGYELYDQPDVRAYATDVVAFSLLFELRTLAARHPDKVAPGRRKIVMESRPSAHSVSMPMHSLRLLILASVMLPACGSTAAPAEQREQAPTRVEGITTTLKPAPGRNFAVLTSVSTGEGAAVVYTDSAAPDGAGNRRTLIMLQRLDGSGAVRGAAIELGAVSAKWYPTLTVATDGTRYLACWATDRISCAFAPVDQGPATPALSLSGSSPSVAYGAGEFALAYGVPGHLAVVRVASDGTAAGGPALFGEGMGAEPAALLAGTKFGFVLVGGGGADGETVALHRIDGALEPVGEPLDLGVPFWFRGVIAASQTNVVVSLSKPYGSYLFDIGEHTISSRLELDGGYKQGLNVAVAADGASFAILSAENVGGFRHSTLAGGRVSASEQVIDADHRYDDGSLALFRTRGGLFFVAGPRLSANEIIVGRIP